MVKEMGSAKDERFKFGLKFMFLPYGGFFYAWLRRTNNRADYLNG